MLILKIFLQKITKSIIPLARLGVGSILPLHEERCAQCVLWDGMFRCASFRFSHQTRSWFHGNLTKIIFTIERVRKGVF